ncbi:MAG: hypothetical protein WCL11_19400 [Verrucomicrobiota bacterium]
MKHPLAYLLAAGVLVGLGASMAAADTVPQVITYQGQIQQTSGVALSKGVYIIVARIWDNATGGSVLWGRLYPVNVDGSGNFNVNLGDGGGTITPAPAYNTLGDALDGGARFLGITVVQTPAGSVGSSKEIAPRMQLVSSPYSFHAGMADYALTWNGLTASQLASVSASAALDTSPFYGLVLGYNGTNMNPMPLTENYLGQPVQLEFTGPTTINGALSVHDAYLRTISPQTTNGIALKNNVRVLGSLTPRAWAVPYTETTDGYLIVNWGYYSANPQGLPSQVWVTLSGLGKIILFQFEDRFRYPSSGFTLLPIPAGMTYTVGATGDGSLGYPGTNWFQAFGQ